MRPILLLVGCSMLGVAATAAYHQGRSTDASAGWTDLAPAIAAQTATGGAGQADPDSATAALTAAIAAAKTAAPAEGAPQTAAAPAQRPGAKPTPLISLAPRGSSNGARFVKPPNSGS